MHTHDEAPPASHTRGIVFILVLVLIGGALLLVWWFQPWAKVGTDPNAQPRAVTARGDLSEMEKMNISIYEAAAPSVVHVTNLASSGGGQFSLNAQEIPKGTGTGFMWDEDGHIVTNFHVVDGADAARVTLADHSTYDAKQIWAAPEMDIAVIQIQAPKSKLHPIVIGSSHDLKVGQITFAIGNPFGLDHTLTTGIVSALGREIEASSGHPIRGAIQTSAAINPGNSGGPLLDSAGRLIGMNTAIVSPSGASAGIGFAIPVDQINQAVPQLIRGGKVDHPKLGIQIAVKQLAEQLGVNEGILILKVIPGGSAANAGLQGTRRDKDGTIHLGDVIVAMDGNAINTAEDLQSLLSTHKVGDKVKVSIVRDGKRQDVEVTL